MISTIFSKIIKNTRTSDINWNLILFLQKNYKHTFSTKFSKNLNSKYCLKHVPVPLNIQVTERHNILLNRFKAYRIHHVHSSSLPVAAMLKRGTARRNARSLASVQSLLAWYTWVAKTAYGTDNRITCIRYWTSVQIVGLIIWRYIHVSTAPTTNIYNEVICL